jgi:hypothetical protein
VEDADISASFHFAIQPLEDVRAVSLGPMFLREARTAATAVPLNKNGRMTLWFDQTQVRLNSAWLADLDPLEVRMQRIEQVV